MRLDHRSRKTTRRAGACLRAGFAALAVLVPAVDWMSTSAQADEPHGLGRLFRFGKSRDAEPGRDEPRGLFEGPSERSSDAPEPTPSTPSPYNPSALNPGAYGTAPRNLSSGMTAPPSTATTYGQPGASSGSFAAPSANRIIPQPRTSEAVTEADPILTRISLNRSNDGNQFGMFFQVYADGTVIDPEGAHQVSHDDLRPLVEALRAADVGRLHGHCGGPPTDFVEQVHLIVYGHNRGRLQANHFSYSGNPQGCDPSIRALQAAIDALQMKITSPGMPPAPAPSAPVASPTPIPTEAPITGLPAYSGTPGVPVSGDAAPPLPGASSPIGLTPVE